MGSMSFSISFLPNALILLRAIHGWTSAWPSTVRSSSVSILTVKCCLAWNRYQIESAKLHQDASAIFKQLLKPNMPFESSWATGWCQRQLSDTQHWWMSANLLKCEVLVVHASIYTNHFKMECLISYSYSYFYALALIHSALCRPTSQVLKQNLSQELSRQLWTQLLIHPWLDRRSDVDVLHAWEKRTSFLRDQEDQEDHKLPQANELRAVPLWIFTM